MTEREREPTASQRNRRQSPRRPGKRSSKIVCRLGAYGMGTNLAVRLLDISEGGVRLVCKPGLEVGKEVEVILETTVSSSRTVRMAKVVWTVPTDSGDLCAGLRFDKTLEYAALLELGNL